ncbi:unnamed protein product [Symbiodinium microadriaticum]|nr:unnamed protein product [Symbiodinium sp. KB8]CAE7782070.1 unnamed protein product [Symbiodinium microadriaticum]
MPLVPSDHTTNVCLLTSWDAPELRNATSEFKSFDRLVLYRTLALAHVCYCIGAVYSIEQSACFNQILSLQIDTQDYSHSEEGFFSRSANYCPCGYCTIDERFIRQEQNACSATLKIFFVRRTQPNYSVNWNGRNAYPGLICIIVVLTDAPPMADCSVLCIFPTLRLPIKSVMSLSKPARAGASAPSNGPVSFEPHNRKKLEANPAKTYVPDASLTEIFGTEVQAGRELVDEIIRVYKVPNIKNVPFFISENDQHRHICRHPLNSRRQDTVLAEYTKTEAFYEAWNLPDREDHPNLKLTAKVEKAWSHHKTEHGITARSAEYETKYRNFVQAQWPETWNSYRHFEATRFVYNALSRYSCLNDFKACAQKHCNFLESELAHDSVIFTMKEIITAFNVCAGAMSGQEQSAVIMELCCASAS